MSTRYNDGSHYENHQRAAELHDLSAHAHRTAEEQHGKQDHLTGHEQSRQALEHHAHEPAAFGHHQIAARAHEIWLAKGRPQGSAEADWFQAAEELRSNARHL